MMGFEPMTSSLPRKRSTPELHRHRAGDEARTRDPNLGRVMLYQLSYSRIFYYKLLLGKPIIYGFLSLDIFLFPKIHSGHLKSIFCNGFQHIKVKCKCTLTHVSKVGRGGFEPPKSYDSRFTVCPSWPLWYLPNYIFRICTLIRCVVLLSYMRITIRFITKYVSSQIVSFSIALKSRADGGIRTHDLLITNQLL